MVQDEEEYEHKESDPLLSKTSQIKSLEHQNEQLVNEIKTLHERLETLESSAFTKEDTINALNNELDSSIYQSEFLEEELQVMNEQHIAELRSRDMELRSKTTQLDNVNNFMFSIVKFLLENEQMKGAIEEVLPNDQIAFLNTFISDTSSEEDPSEPSDDDLEHDEGRNSRMKEVQEDKQDL